VSDLRTGGGFNAFHYSNPKADELIDQGQAESDPAKRKEIYRSLRTIIAEDVPITFAHYETLNYLMQKNVVGSTINPNLQLRLESVGRSTCWFGSSRCCSSCATFISPQPNGRRLTLAIDGERHHNSPYWEQCSAM